MEIYVYLLTPGQYRVLIHGSQYKLLYKGNLPADSESHALRQALDILDKQGTENA